MNRQVIKNRIRKVLAYTVTGVSFVLISAFLTLQIPAVQEHFITRYLRTFSQVTGFESTVENFRLLWFDRLELENLTVYDPDHNKMIFARKVMINFKLTQLLQQNDVNVDGVALEDAHVFLTKIPENDSSKNLNINVFIRRINQHYAGSGGSRRSPRINIGEAVLTESQFTYVDQFRDSVKTGFNYNQFSFNIDEAQLQNFLIIGDTTQFNVNTMLATDRQSGLAIKQLSTFFRLSQQSMEFYGLDLKANESRIADSIVFTFNGQRELSDFVDKVRIHASLKNTVLDPQDLALFAPEAGRISQPISLQGAFNGRVNNFRFTDMIVSNGNTRLHGSLDMEGLPDLNETFIILELKSSRLDFEDLGFAINPAVMAKLKPIGMVSLEGQFLGYTSDFVANGKFSGALGNISSDINFKVNEKNFDRSEYSGEIVLSDFDLGQYLKDTINFQKIDLDGKVKGSGLTMQTADFTLKGEISSVGIKNYNYTNISTNARFASQLFSGFFRIDDPNLEFTAQGSVDFRHGNDLINVQAKLDTAYLHNLNLTPHRIFLRTSLDINTRGLHLDSLRGTADLKDLTILYDGKRLDLANIHLSAERTEQERALVVESTLVNAAARGDFMMSDITRDVQKLVNEILLNIRNDREEIETYYRTKNYTPAAYETAFKIDILDLDPLTDLLGLNLFVADKTSVQGKFTSGHTTILQAYSTIDSLAFNNILLLDTEAEITASKIADSTSVLAMAFLNSARQVINNRLRTKDLYLEGIWNENHVDFEFNADQEGENNYVRLRGEVDFSKDNTFVHLLPSTINLLEKQWEVDTANLITMQRRNIGIRNLQIRHDDQSLLVNGALTDDPEGKLSASVNNLDLSILNPITGRNITGRLQAAFELSNYFTDLHLQNDVRIDSLTIDDFLIGDVTGKNQWDTIGNKFILDFFIDRNAARIVNINGVYNPSRESNPLDVNANLEKANLKILEPFFDYMFSNIGGTITGDYRITGKLESPAIAGEGKVADGQITINYLKTQYDFSGTVGLSPNSIYFRDIDLSDNFRNRARLNGTITHQDFKSMRINLDASFRNFHVLNTTAKDNSLFYGQGFATGDLNVFGPIANLKFTAIARTDRNTRIYIPIGDEATVEKKEFIKFVSFSDSTFQKTISDRIANKLDLSGITLDFNIDVTDEAYCEILLNAQAGDKIRGRGKGELQLQLDTKGEFNMFGPFEFTEGWYTFTLYDLVNKEFEIRKGSRITWYGDAYEGNLDISAAYNQQASFAPIILDDEIRDSPQLRRKYPVQVLIELDGPMLSPEINFDIVTQDLPQSIIVENKPPVRLDFEFQAFKNKMDEQELKRQVFSLIVLRRFSPPESFNTSSSDVINSVSELFSNQLSNFVSQVDENLEIDVDFSRMDEEEFNTFQLRLSYTFLNGRLRVTRDGTFYTSQNSSNGINTNQNLSSLAGDWTVDYILTGDGKLKVKMYNRTNINPIFNSLNAQNSVTTGVSINHTQSFNELKDLWNSRNKTAPEEGVDPNEEATRKEDDGGE